LTSRDGEAACPAASLLYERRASERRGVKDREKNRNAILWRRGIGYEVSATRKNIYHRRVKMKKFLLKIALAGVFLIVSGTAVFSENFLGYGVNAEFECVATNADQSRAQECASEFFREWEQKKNWYGNPFYKRFRPVAKVPESHSQAVYAILQEDNASPGDVYTVRVLAMDGASLYVILVKPNNGWTWWSKRGYYD
jgi:hypothetical protein